jgi:hypothetical protein
MTTPSPLGVIGVPLWAITEALAANDLDKIARLANGFYGVLAKEYHTDLVGPGADRMREIGAAIAEIRNPAGLRVLAEWEVDPTAVDQERRSAMVSRMHDRSSTIAQNLARALASADPMRVLQTTTPIELFAALIGPSGPSAGSYHQAVVAKVTGSDCTVMISAPVDADDDAALFDGKPRYVKSRKVWRDLAAISTGGRLLPVLRQRAIGRLKPVPGDIRLVGGVPPDAVTMAPWADVDLEEPIEPRFALEAIVASVAPRGFEWTSLDTAWWMSDLQPHAGPGDYLVFMNAQPSTPLFALAGPLLATRPL